MYIVIEKSQTMFFTIYHVFVMKEIPSVYRPFTYLYHYESIYIYIYIYISCSDLLHIIVSVKCIGSFSNAQG